MKCLQKSLDKAHSTAHSGDFIGWSVIDIEDRLQLLEQDWESFRTEHEKVIETLQNEAEEVEEGKIWDDGQEGYLAAQSLFRTRISVLAPKPQNQPQQAVENKITIEMPEIPNTWGTFHGGETGPIEWPKFRDLDATRKFSYLEKALKGEAKDVRGRLERTEANYILIWDRLKKRYETSRFKKC